MRQDMFKVIVERPRRKSGWTSAIKGRRNEYNRVNTLGAAWDPEVYDEPCNWEKIRPTGRGVDRKELNENLRPLWRFLEDRVGHSWDEVYSEVRENLSPNSAVQMHVVQHLKQRVETDTFKDEEGTIWAKGSYKWSKVDVPSYYRTFYVHPETKLLCTNKKTFKKLWKRERSKGSVIQLSTFTQYRLIDGVWYWVRLDFIPEEKARFGPGSRYINGKFIPVKTYEHVTDLVFKKLPGGRMSPWDREQTYGADNLWAVEKRQAGKRELREIKKLLQKINP